MIYIVQAGDTLGQIAAQYGTTYQALAAENHIQDPNVISVGEKIVIKGGYSSWTPPTSPGPSYSQSSPSSSRGSSSSASPVFSSGYHIPGVSDSVANCIAQHESNNGQSSSNVFQITPGSGYSVTPGMSLEQQEQVAGQVAASQGVHAAWGAYDHCA